MTAAEIEDVIQKLEKEIEALEKSDSPYKYQSISVCKEQMQSGKERLEEITKEERT